MILTCWVPATLDAGVRQIQCVADALDFLDDWPADQRGIMFDMTQDALYSGQDGRMPTSAARDAFANWARVSDTLEDLSLAAAWMTGPKLATAAFLVDCLSGRRRPSIPNC